MRVLSSPQHYLFNLETTNSQEAKKVMEAKDKGIMGLRMCLLWVR